MNLCAVRLSELIKNSELSLRDLENKTNIPRSAIQRYAAGTTEKIPTLRIKAFATIFGTSVEYLMGWTDEKDPNVRPSNTQEFVELFNQLTTDQQSLIIASMKGILNCK